MKRKEAGYSLQFDREVFSQRSVCHYEGGY